MRFLHVSDLHLGKKLNGFNLFEDQEYILKEIVEIAKNNDVDAVLIAGDVYDVTNPTDDAIYLFERFLLQLNAAGMESYVISGNHDSANKLSYMNWASEKYGMHIANPPVDTLQKFTCAKDGESVDIYMMPYIQPHTYRLMDPESKVSTYEDAVRKTIEKTKLTPGRRILMAHQFVVSGTADTERTQSETLIVGGVDKVDVSLFDDFDYVALGHIHRAQKVGRETVRYSGSPLKYSKSEVKGDKVAVLVDVSEEVKVTEIPLKPLRNVRTIPGYLDDIIAKSRSDEHCDDYIYAELDDISPVNAMETLRKVYPHTLALEVSMPEYEPGESPDEPLEEDKDPVELFTELFEERFEHGMTDSQMKRVVRAYEEAEQ